MMRLGSPSGLGAAGLPPSAPFGLLPSLPGATPPAALPAGTAPNAAAYPIVSGWYPAASYAAVMGFFVASANAEAKAGGYSVAGASWAVYDQATLGLLGTVPLSPPLAPAAPVLPAATTYFSMLSVPLTSGSGGAVPATASGDGWAAQGPYFASQLSQLLAIFQQTSPGWVAIYDQDGALVSMAPPVPVLATKAGGGGHLVCTACPPLVQLPCPEVAQTPASNGWEWAWTTAAGALIAIVVGRIVNGSPSPSKARR